LNDTARKGRREDKIEYCGVKESHDLTGNTIIAEIQDAVIYIYKLKSS